MTTKIFVSQIDVTNPDGNSAAAGSFIYLGSNGPFWYEGVVEYTGFTGSTGNAGANGYSGSTGFTGSIGFQGSAGFKGSEGYRGSVGYQGSVGGAGYIGSSGYRGSAGYQGSAGRYMWDYAAYAAGSVIDNNVLKLVTGETIDISTATLGTQIYFVDNGDIIMRNANTASPPMAGYNWNQLGSTKGYAGSRGAAGANGAIGYTGSTGYVGSSGVIGGTGYTGSVGYQGSAGVAGPAGVVGYRGSVGGLGGTGYTGSAGPDGDGYAGSAGYTGSVGATGYRGSAGYQGSVGQVGYSGSQGTAGYTGSVGFFGSVGYIGSPGTEGPLGLVGYSGSAGDQGPVGYQGSAGLAGAVSGTFLDLSDTPNAYTANAYVRVNAGGTNLIFFDGSSLLSNTWSTNINANNYIVASPVLLSYGEAIIPTSGISSKTIDPSKGNIFNVNLASSLTTITLSSAPSSSYHYSVTLYIKQDATGGRTIDWSLNTIYWPTAEGIYTPTGPTLSIQAGYTDIITLTTKDGGTTWYGMLSAKGFATP